MSVLVDRYAKLGPDLALLADEAVLAQAWKKSDSHIRRHNWYADILELDLVLTELPEAIQEWSKDILAGGMSPVPMCLVPAPKNAHWHFPSDNPSGTSPWTFKPTEGANSDAQQPSLRPLAHVTIRDQTVSTAVMLCLADAVETMQGNVAQIDYRTAQQSGVYSYGNRLFCRWDTPTDSMARARFSWGNAGTYSKYFEDYHRFLERPAQVCRDWSGRLPPGRRLYVISLDLSKFYDNVDRRLLVSRLRHIYSDYAKRFDPEYSKEASRPFWECLSRVMTWSWREEDEVHASALGLKTLPDGLPQGLVASGFFANAYMIQFDHAVGEKIGQEIDGITLLDYCRYVDDLRLVVSSPESGSEWIEGKGTQQGVNGWIDGLLKDQFLRNGATKRLSVQEKKTEVVVWEDLAVQGRMSQHMRGIQAGISVTPDAETLRQTTEGLDHLLWLADTLEDSEAHAPRRLPLAAISAPRVDVRDDTIKRFAANRLSKVMRLRRSMAESRSPGPPKELAGPEVSGLALLDHEMETMARKLVACWARNPALVSVLRRGLDLFPSPSLLLPVLDALRLKLDEPHPDRPNERMVAQYVLADLLRAGAVETGYGPTEDYPEHADIAGYRRELKKLALLTLKLEDAPWFVQQQAAMFLASQNFPVEIQPRDLHRAKMERYRLLHEALRREPLPDSRDFLAIALTACRISPNTEDFALWFGECLRRFRRKRADRIARQLGLIQPDLLHAVVRTHPESRQLWAKWTAGLLPPRGGTTVEKRLHELGAGPFPLARLARHPENPFTQENALLKLAEALLERMADWPSMEGIGLQSILVSCKNLGQIQNPSRKLDVSPIQRPAGSFKSWGEIPSWCRPEMFWAFTLGRVLRSAIIGEDDYTSRYYPAREVVGSYNGLRSNWFRRRLGLSILAQGLGEEPVPVSPWLDELILRLLQWPGLEMDGELVAGFRGVRKPTELLPIIRKRKGELRRLYGRASELPIYPLRSLCAGTDLRRFRVAVVQVLLPRDSDFSASSPTFWSPEFRRRHRAHLHAMCHLVDQHLRAVESSHDSQSQQTLLDLVVFPELAVHPDDLQALVRLSDRTRGAIFAGLTFSEHPFLRKPINRAVWILRRQSRSGRQIVPLYQGKSHMTSWEEKAGVAGHRPYQLLIEFRGSSGRISRLTGAICYDATDLKLAADLRDISDGFVIAALNKDVNTFDTMAEALQYHLYQPVVLANAGQYGGSNALAPYKEPYERLIAHVHGKDQAAVCLFELDLLAFKAKKPASKPKERKLPPAGYEGRR